MTLYYKYTNFEVQYQLINEIWRMYRHKGVAEKRVCACKRFRSQGEPRRKGRDREPVMRRVCGLGGPPQEITEEMTPRENR